MNNRNRDFRPNRRGSFDDDNYVGRRRDHSRSAAHRSPTRSLLERGGGGRRARRLRNSPEATISAAAQYHGVTT